MSNPMRYIRALEAAGFDRTQAEAQVQMVLDALEGDLVTKADFMLFQEKLDHRFVQERAHTDAQFAQIDARFNRLEARVDSLKPTILTEFEINLKELEFRLTTRLGAMMLSTVSVAVAILAWLIKV